MKKNQIKDNFNEENTYNLFLPSTKKKNDNNNKELINENNKNLLGISSKKPKKKKTNKLSKNNSKDIINNQIKNNSKNNPSINSDKIEVHDIDIQAKLKKGKNKKNIINKESNKNEKEIDNPNKLIESITINEVENKYVPKFSKNKRKLPSLNIYCIYRRNAYPLIFNTTSKVKDIYIKLSKELNIEKYLLELRINERIINNLDEEKLIKDLIEQEKNDKIYVTKLLPNYNLINNIYNKTYNNKVIIENSNEIEEIEKKLNKFLEEYHMEKDYYFHKISDNKYSFGFSYPDFAFDFNRLLLILKRTENDFKNIKSYLKLEKKKNFNK